ncbi:hypothetical protein [Microcoleus sp. D2_18a_B4]|uniref:hypothetical protein n=2 Tax=unclassified Microcoleus TaxID=2642155 RepID=UPI002FCE9E24
MNSPVEKLGSLSYMRNEKLPATQQSPINSGVTGMMGSGEWGVGKCGIIDLDFIIPIQPETISNLKSKTASQFHGQPTQNLKSAI